MSRPDCGEENVVNGSEMGPYLRVARWCALGAALALVGMVAIVVGFRTNDMPDDSFPNGPTVIVVLGWLAFLGFSALTVVTLLVGMVRTRRPR
jgi:hypothetical protein